MPLLGQLDLVTRRWSVGEMGKTSDFNGLTRIGGLIFSINGISTDIEEVPSLVQLATFAAQIDLSTIVRFAQSRLDLLQSISLGVIGGNSRGGEGLGVIICEICPRIKEMKRFIRSRTYLVSIQTLEQVDRLFEVGSNLLLW